METLSGSIMNSSWRFSSVESRRHGHISMGGISRAQLCQPQSRAEESPDSRCVCRVQVVGEEGEAQQVTARPCGCAA